MANNVNAAANTFSNNEARIAASQWVVAYRTAKQFLSDWANGSYQTLIANTTDKMDDGSLSGGTWPGQPSGGDGRQNITGGLIYVLASNSQTLVNTFEANSNLILNQMLQVANGSSSITPGKIS